MPVQLVAGRALLASPQRLYFWQAGVLVLEIPSGDAALLTNDMHFAKPQAVKSWPCGWCEHPGLLLLTREELKTACVSLLHPPSARVKKQSLLGLCTEPLCWRRVDRKVLLACDQQQQNH